MSLESSTSPVRSGVIIWSAMALLVLTIAHDLDHMRQARSLGSDFYSIGVYSIFLAVVMVWSAFYKTSVAPVLAIVVGLQTALGLLFIHILPRTGTLSDSYGRAHVDNLSWTIVLLLFASGVTLTVGGITELIQRRSIR